MAPELVTGDPVDARSDLFAVGAILFEMLAGRPAFTGRTVAEVLQATADGAAACPAGSAGGRGGRPRHPPRAREESRRTSCLRRGDGGTVERACAASTASRPARWRKRSRGVVVLPFRVLRPDPETDFLAFSLPDAITTSLAGSGSLIVRSSATAARFARGRAGHQGAGRGGRRRSRGHGHAPALGRSAARGDAARRSARRHAADVAHGAVAARRSVPDAGRHRAARGRRRSRCRWPASALSPSPDAPHDPSAYELYLRANGSRAPTTDCRTRGRCTSSASSSIRRLRPHGRIWAAAIG